MSQTPAPEGRSKSCSHQSETLQPRASVRLGAPLRDLANFDTLFRDSAPDLTTSPLPGLFNERSTALNSPCPHGPSSP